jgi:hypothetical protein
MKISINIILIILLLIAFCSPVSGIDQESKNSVSNYGLSIGSLKLSEAMSQQIPRRGEEKPPEERRKLGSKEKSLLFPGWGQISEKRYGRGLTFMFSEIACISSAIVYTVKGSHSYSNYQNADNTPDAIYYRELTEKYDKRRNISLALGAIVWAVNLLDMSLAKEKSDNASENNKDKQKKEYNLHLDLNPAGGCQVQFILQF